VEEGVHTVLVFQIGGEQMGREIEFYMMAEDRDAFLDVARDGGPTVVIERDSNSEVMRPLQNADLNPYKTLCLWNSDFLPQVSRKWVPEADCYRVDTLHNPILEFMPSIQTTWKRHAALGQGRLFVEFEAPAENGPGKAADFQNLYERLEGWLRKNYRRNTAKWGGYVGPAAYEFFNGGGYFLPSVKPPTKVFLAEMAKQHGSKASR
jgi:hypothetical protein